MSSEKGALGGQSASSLCLDQVCAFEDRMQVVPAIIVLSDPELTAYVGY